MKTEKIIVYTDGGSRGNPGSSGVGVVFANAKNEITQKYSKDIGVRTNNEAEYEAVILAFLKIKHLYGKEKARRLEVEMRMDSQLVARQLKGEYKMEAEHLWPLFMKIWNLRIELGFVGNNFKIIEIPREKNKEADILANEAMDGKKTKSLF